MTDPLQPPTVNGVPIAHGDGVVLFQHPDRGVLTNVRSNTGYQTVNDIIKERDALTAELALATRQREEIASLLAQCLSVIRFDVHLGSGTPSDGIRQLIKECDAALTALANNKATT